GSVAGSLHVVVAHDGNLRTTYAFLAGIGVRAGDRVERGQVVGTAGSTGAEHDVEGLHFGVRLGDRYVDPQRLFAACDLTQLLLAVGGIDTAGAPDEPTFGLDTRALGYRDDEVRYFSYAPDGGAYRAQQTHGDLQRAGLRLAEQLKEAEREHPGREVDLIAHSQGGVVVDVFLQDYYDAADPAYPPIGTVVTLSSPHEGVPLATAAADWRASPVGRPLVEAAEERLPVA